ncbi:MAG TPA: 16S rRNA (cytidine(1402)-2'-O)-methyltransferase [Trueperaceae bacterium]|nr:16S rRNA (cytidine(1402)-2'-O)-methyltransferase [Trueperaceae bacterium]
MSRLSLVPTPIGNLGDITARALEVLGQVDAVAAEDTRRSRHLLDHFGIRAHLERLDAHTMEARAPGLLQRYQHLAFVTDAGTPGISDPGAELVRLAVSLGVDVEVLPGPTAFVPALVLSCLPTARFTFEGFLPRKGSDRSRRLRAIATSTATTVLYEAPQRLAATLAQLAEVCGAERAASVSREVSKRFETTLRGTLHELSTRIGEEGVKGEVVVVVGPAAAEPERPAAAGTATALARAGVRGGLLRAALEALGVPRNEAYAAALEHPERGHPE